MKEAEKLRSISLKSISAAKPHQRMLHVDLLAQAWEKQLYSLRPCGLESHTITLRFHGICNQH
ncbi:hypothetical protein CO614_08835 [Lysobacteraceae bacterium NML120232]|nr:hypothetical protein CO614_08835 [Xanthomonadaceae bacterium NML120232]PJK10945.1 hypothetical protein CO608_00230 [Xanthomonadaceae bacterium NML08-0793]